MNRFLSKWYFLVVAALLMGVLLVIGFQPQAQLAPEEGQLTSIQSIETLRTQFNHDQGKIRLIMLLSPT